MFPAIQPNTESISIYSVFSHVHYVIIGEVAQQWNSWTLYRSALCLGQEAVGKGLHAPGVSQHTPPLNRGGLTPHDSHLCPTSSSPLFRLDAYCYFKITTWVRLQHQNICCFLTRDIWCSNIPLSWQRDIWCDELQEDLSVPLDSQQQLNIQTLDEPFCIFWRVGGKTVISSISVTVTKLKTQLWCDGCTGSKMMTRPDVCGRSALSAEWGPGMKPPSVRPVKVTLF